MRMNRRSDCQPQRFRMNVCLINPPYLKRFSRQQRSPAVIKSGTLYYPYWLSFATGVLQEADFNSLLIDAVADNLDFEQCIAKVTGLGADLAVIESSTPSIASDLAFCHKLKKRSEKTVVVLVGTHASVLYEQILRDNPTVDIIVIGEYEYTIRDLACCLSVGGNLRDVKGIVYREDGRSIKTSERPYISDLDALPFVSRIYKECLDINRYYFSLARHPMVMLITGRGCPNRCFFCLYPQTLHGYQYRFRSPENVLEELQYIRLELPQVKEIVFEDDTFTADEKRVIEICRLILKKNIDFGWFANVRVDTRLETLKAMRAAGLKRCAVGFESGSQTILDVMAKGTTIEQAIEFKRYCDRLGILVHGCFMVGFPGETKQTMQQTFEFAKKLNCDSVQFYPVFLYPGTKAYKWAEVNGYIKTKDFAKWLTADGYHSCVLNMPGLNSNEMSDFCEQAYKKYYLSEKYIALKLKQSFLNPKEFKRNFRGGANFLFYLTQHRG